jgi:C-1 hydroxylase
MEGDTMSLEKNKAIIRSLIEVFNKHDVPLMDNFIAPDVVIDKTLRGLDNFKKFETSFIKGFPDYHETIEDIIAEGDKVWVRITYTGTHKGEYRRIAPNGKKHTIVGVVIYQIFNGKIVEAWVVEDALDSLKQLGLIEYTETGKRLFPEELQSVTK